MEVGAVAKWVMAAATALLLVQVSAADGSEDLAQLALRALQEALQSPKDVYSDEVMERLALESNVAADDIGPRLRELLDRLDSHRQAKSQTWKDLVAARGREVPEKKAAKLLKLLIQGARDMTEGQGRYVIDRRLHWAGKKARVPMDQAEAMVLRLLAWSLRDPELSAEEEGIGLVVSGQTGVFEIARDPLRVFFDGQDEAFIHEQVRDIQRFVVPGVVRQLARHDGIAYAVRDRDRTALVDPDYAIHITMEAMGFAGSNADLRPCAEGTLVLTPRHGTAAPWSQQFKWCTEEHGSAHEDGLGPFYDEVAGKICEITEEYLKRGDAPQAGAE